MNDNLSQLPARYSTSNFSVFRLGQPFSDGSPELHQAKSENAGNGMWKLI